ncbi:flagellar basal body P-ring formation chaperone FlgA [Nereida sp. MMG025]|uniref:flagellar basal body P-ring formation chaperone FlgA n=1 Tax=Nereida sp. MMG025 TaxID=2909981 RepID=UPI001F3039D3|nr:flagellar basal body P-ring formation chaperone FlgA [Nereida sp. MMG025]MCF6444679.1 flagellar basal body P-ring formation protein FlgA [Nereida sp. MMG025]
MIRFATIFAVCTALPALADTVVATGTIRAKAILGPEDIMVKDIDVDGAFRSPLDVIGLEARVVLYPGRPIKLGDLGAPAIVTRNQMVTLVYTSGALMIATDARALERGGVGDWVRVMNQSSRTTVSGQIQKDGTVHVKP